MLGAGKSKENTEKSATTKSTDKKEATQDKTVSAVQIVTTGAPSRGAKNPKVTVVKFSDFYCGNCKKVSMTLAELVQDKKYQNSVSFVYMPYPIYGAKAMLVAQEAVCAAKQNKFWQFHDMVFASHGKLKEATGTEVAQKLSLDMKAFDQCKAKEEAKKMVQTTKAEGDKVGVKATPTLYVNGMMVTDHSKASLMAALDQALAATSSKKTTDKKES